MYENMFDVLIYLYENYMDGESHPPIDQGDLEDELSQAGFTHSEIRKALHWLDELADGSPWAPYLALKGSSIRVYTTMEMAKLDLEARGLLLFLEQTGILDPASRELVIERALAIEQAIVTLDELKWVVLLVLMNRPGREDAFNQMESLIYNEAPAYLH
jgi:Smg protein